MIINEKKDRNPKHNTCFLLLLFFLYGCIHAILKKDFQTSIKLTNESVPSCFVEKEFFVRGNEV